VQTADKAKNLLFYMQTNLKLKKKKILKTIGFEFFWFHLGLPISASRVTRLGFPGRRQQARLMFNFSMCKKISSLGKVVRKMCLRKGEKP
jgi:hypothetical protein